MTPIEPTRLERETFLGMLPVRSLDAHKGHFGSVAIIGGAEGMVGALLLSARAALLAGAGRVYASSVSTHPLPVDMQYPEVMMQQPSALMQLRQLDCLVLGPGLGRSEVACSLLDHWLKQDKPLLLDADALNLIAMQSHLQMLLSQRHAQTVITPHAEEAAKLLKSTATEVQSSRVESAIKLAKKFGVICVLKGAGTVCAHPDGTCFINTSGNPGLATGGTGDVLSGVISALMAQGLDVLEAAKMGVFVHGVAADVLVERGCGPVGLTASEVALEVRNVINALTLLSDSARMAQLF